MKRLPWVCWAKFIFRDCAGGEAFTEAGEKGLDRSKRDFLGCCITCSAFFFLFSSIQRMALASPRFLDIVTLLCPTLNSGNFRLYNFFKNKKPSFHWQMKKGESWVWGLPAKCVCEAHPGLAVWGGWLSSVSLGILWVHHCQAQCPREAGANRVSVEMPGTRPVFGRAVRSPFPVMGTSIHQPQCSWESRGVSRWGERWEPVLALALNWQRYASLMWLCWAWHLCHDVAERGK